MPLRRPVWPFFALAFASACHLVAGFDEYGFGEPVLVGEGGRGGGDNTGQGGAPGTGAMTTTEVPATGGGGEGGTPAPCSSPGECSSPEVCIDGGCRPLTGWASPNDSSASFSNGIVYPEAAGDGLTRLWGGSDFDGYAAVFDSLGNSVSFAPLDAQIRVIVPTRADAIAFNGTSRTVAIADTPGGGSLTVPPTLNTVNKPGGSAPETLLFQFEGLALECVAQTERARFVAVRDAATYLGLEAFGGFDFD
ncbi:MAG: hypothetical protein AAGA56_26900, partial [Myxococcota bacterium]